MIVTRCGKPHPHGLHFALSFRDPWSSLFNRARDGLPGLVERRRHPTVHSPVERCARARRLSIDGGTAYWGKTELSRNGRQAFSGLPCVSHWLHSSRIRSSERLTIVCCTLDLLQSDGDEWPSMSLTRLCNLFFRCSRTALFQRLLRL